MSDASQTAFQHPMPLSSDQNLRNAGLSPPSQTHRQRVQPSQDNLPRSRPGQLPYLWRPEPEATGNHAPVRLHQRNTHAGLRDPAPTFPADLTTSSTPNGSITSTAAAESSTSPTTESGPDTVIIEEQSIPFPEGLTETEIHDEVARRMQNVQDRLQEYLLATAHRADTGRDRADQQRQEIFPADLSNTMNELLEDAEARMAELNEAQRQRTRNATTVGHGTYQERQARRNAAHADIGIRRVRQQSPPPSADVVTSLEGDGTEEELLRNLFGDEFGGADEQQPGDHSQRRRLRSDTAQSFMPERHPVDSDSEEEAEGFQNINMGGIVRWYALSPLALQGLEDEGIDLPAAGETNVHVGDEYMERLERAMRRYWNDW